MFTADACDIRFAVAHVLSSFHHDGTQSQLYQPQCGKQSSGTCTHHYYLGAVLYLTVFRADEFFVMRNFIDIETHFQVDINSTLAGINTSFQDTDGMDGAYVQSFFTSDKLFECLFTDCLFRQCSQLEFLYHIFFIYCRA